MILSRRRWLLAGAFQSKIPGRVRDDWQGVARVVAVGDVHGDKDAFAAVLKMAGVIDAQENWTGGRTHVVQIGDIPSRGSQSRQCFDLMMRLEPQAEAAGGHLHALIGNHDAGVIYGDRRSVLPAEYAEFRTDESPALLEAAWEAEVAAHPNTDRAHWFEFHPPGYVEHTRAFSPQGAYGFWIRRHNAVIRINDTLFVHGGISPKHARRTRSSLNETIRRELADPERLIPGLTSEVLGPLWYRGLAEEEEQDLERHLAAVLAFHGVRRIVIGHTVTRTAILPRFSGRVVNIDIGLSRFYGRPPACLILEMGKATVLHRGVPIPLGTDRGAYLRQVAAADGQESPVRKLLP